MSGNNQGKDREKPKTIFPQIEEEIFSYWEKEKVFEKVLQKTKKGKSFIFYEGPPYANGRPGIHHVLARAYKDVILRFKTMQGYYIPRKAGWDTHGLPTEMEVEKKLNVHTKKEIEALGIETFVETARNNVFEYKSEWERVTRRMGYWLDLKHPYVTMTNEYIEGLWRVFAGIADNGYLYKDYKVLPWCPRCETSLSSHEVAQGYKKVTDTSVYLKFSISNSQFPNTYFLAWTTTPWTLPGNVALAVNPKSTYVTAEKGAEKLILAETRLSILGEGWKVTGKQKGKDLEGMYYEPLYPISSKLQDTGYKEDREANMYKVVTADFVTLEDGTGIVHIAPAFGADDQKVGKKHHFLTLVTVGEDGRMQTPGHAWNGQLFSEANISILKDLAEKKLLFKKESYEHDYPFCWRCKSALIYYAKNSWFLKTTSIKGAMQKENARVNWHPSFVGQNRFGAWLKENVDWAISRERYWGMPLPIWICEQCGKEQIISSLNDLDTYAPHTKTQLYIMRHGEASHNISGIVGPPTPQTDKHNSLTEKGKKDVLQAAKKLKGAIDIIVASPLKRAQETARIIEDELKGIPVETHKDMYDINVGEYHGKQVAEVNKIFPLDERFENPYPEGESIRDARRRIMNAFQEILSLHKDKRILIISHGDPLWILQAALEGKKEEEYGSSWYPKTGEVKKLRLHNWPYSVSRGELDFHRPYIDGIVLRCKDCRNTMKRVSDVADVWFDSGAMPFAQNIDSLGKFGNWKLEIGNLRKRALYPADYICEGIDQTRGWFYTLLAVSSLLKLPAPYRNILTVGLVLDEKGEKMSKSRENTVEPFSLFERYGADAVRWYFYTINQPWDEKLFNEADVQSASRKFLMIAWNIFQYWDGAGELKKVSVLEGKPSLFINMWMQARIDKLIADVTKSMNAYDVVRAARELEDFVGEDVSRWYIRRIRDVMKTGTVREKKETEAILGFIIETVALLVAPFAPFMSEALWRGIGKKESVHFASWPKQKLNKKEVKMLSDMKHARDMVSAALQERANAGIKVRQPLAELRVKSNELRLRKNKKIQELIMGEVNVKKITCGAKIKTALELDTNLTHELKKEGAFRDLVRGIQDMRKEANLKSKDAVTLNIGSDDKGKEFIREFRDDIQKAVNAKKIIEGELSHQLFMKKSLQAGEYYFEIGLKK